MISAGKRKVSKYNDPDLTRQQRMVALEQAIEKQVAYIEKLKNIRRLRLMKYHDYLASSHWQKMKARVRKIHQVCQVCKTSDKLEVHHRTYAALGNENIEDLYLLCDNCHHGLHERLKAK